PLDKTSSYRADGDLRLPENLGLVPVRRANGVVGNDPDRPGPDLPRPLRPLVKVVAPPPLPRAVCIVDGHPDHGNRGVDAGDRPHARNPASGADDHSAVDLLAEDGVRAADISGAFGCHGGGLDPKAELAKDLGGIEHALVARAAPLGEREVEVPGLDLDAQHARLEQPERLEEQFFAGLIPVEHSNRVGGHRPNDMARSTADRAGGQLGGEQRADVELFARAPSVNGAAESSATIDSA